ncbi:hypothetical protein IKQ38_01920 [Candidatus Saccharibacteria bacterium]|nr:hypothetical protein [Candidatus Saccharibacteria bacterium]
MAAKNKNTKKYSKNREKTSVFSVLLSVALVAVIVFGVLVLFDESKVDDNSATDETETSDVKPDKDNKDNNNTAPISDKSDDSNNADENSSYDTKDAYEQEHKTSGVEINDNGKKIATPYVSINQNSELVIVSARISNFKEEGGSCTYTISKGTESKIYTKDILPDPKAMVCEALQLKKNELSSGEWTVKVEYKSNTAEGQSEAQKFTI